MNFISENEIWFDKSFTMSEKNNYLQIEGTELV